MKSRGRVAALVLLCVFPLVASAQNATFGKNKVQYKRFTYYFIQSDHFDIYFTDGGDDIARFAAIAAESAYVSIKKLFRYQLVNRVSWVVYNSHNDFQQTNVISQYLEEGIGGVTELFKNRIVVPFEGDYRKFRHVIHHELVHAVVNDMFYGGSIQSIITNNITLQFPDWFDEGLAEFEALRWDTNSDMFIADATTHENLPSITGLYGYNAYRGGQSMWWYISRKYGEQKIGEILNRIKSTRSIEAGFRGAIGLGIEELSERWQKDQKVLYWPEVAKREEPADFARRLTDHRKDGAFYNTSPSISPQGDRVAFISNRNEYFDVFLLNTIDGTVTKKLVNGQTSTDFEELHLLTPGISWSPDGTRLALATKAGEQDAILIIDVVSEKQEKLTFGLDGIFSVEWSRGGNEIAFVGNTSAQSDIYVYNLTTKQLRNVTDDIFSDSDPSWSPDGATVYFSSDRGDARRGDNIDMTRFDYSDQSLYRVSLESGEVERIVEWKGSDETSTVVSSDGSKILFVSDRNGIANVYLMDLTSKEIRPITNSLSGVYQLSLSRDGTKLAFSSLNNSGFDLFLMRNPFERDIKRTDLEPTEFIRMRQQKKGPPPPPDSVAVAKAEEARKDTARYGENVQIDFSNYVFGEEQEDVPHDSVMVEKEPQAAAVDTSSEFVINNYKLNFSPDIIYGSAGYDTFYGVSGTTIMAFSDLLGDHQIVFQTNLLLDLKNSDYGLQYFYLRDRIDYGFNAFHSARFVLIDDIFGGSLYRFRTYGGGLAILYPLNRFDRFETGLTIYDISKENLDIIAYPTERRTVAVPQVSYTHDNSLWGYISPMNGSRYTVSVFGTPKIGATGLSFVNFTFDYRTYIRLGRFYTLALRTSGGGSFGEDPQKFIVGGVENWITPRFDRGFPIESAEDYIFLQAGLPLRGYNYNARVGSRYALFNMELRYPLFAFFQAGPLPIGLQSFQGVLFFDAGTAWTDDNQLQLFQRTPEGHVISRDLLMGTGLGARVIFLAFLIRFDVGWAWNYNGFSTPKYYFSFGLDY